MGWLAGLGRFDQSVEHHLGHLAGHVSPEFSNLGGRSLRQQRHHLEQFARVRGIPRRFIELRFFLIEIVIFVGIVVFLEIRKVGDGPRRRMFEGPEGALGSLDGFVIAAAAGLLKYGFELGRQAPRLNGSSS